MELEHAVCLVGVIKDFKMRLVCLVVFLSLCRAGMGSKSAADCGMSKGCGFSLSRVFQE